jgi:hypothetical protein
MARRSEQHPRSSASGRTRLRGDADLIDLVGRILAAAARQRSDSTEPPPVHGKSKAPREFRIRWISADE